MSVLHDAISRSTRLGDKTKDDYLRCVGRFVAFAGADPSGWSGAAVERWRDALLGADMSPRTVNKHLYALRYASQRLPALGTGFDFARGAETIPAPQMRSRRAMTYDEVAAIYSTCRHDRAPDVRDRAALTFLLRTGARRENLCKLNWGDFTESGRSVRMVVKGRKHLQVPLDDELHTDLRAWATLLEGHGVALRGGVVRRLVEQLSGAYTVSRPIRRLAWVNEMVAARAKEAGIRRPVTPHLFRHTFITWALEAGEPPWRVMLMTGHSDMKTLSGYAHDLSAEENPVGNKLPSFR